MLLAAAARHSRTHDCLVFRLILLNSLPRPTSAVDSAARKRGGTAKVDNVISVELHRRQRKRSEFILIKVIYVVLNYDDDELNDDEMGAKRV